MKNNLTCHIKCLPYQLCHCMVKVVFEDHVFNSCGDRVDLGALSVLCMVVEEGVRASRGVDFLLAEKVWFLRVPGH